MTNKEILEKAIEKAVKNGFVYPWKEAGIPFGQIMNNYMNLIFQHHFARAFWGENEIEYTEYPFCYHVNGGDESECTDKAWRVHLSQMVLEPEPLKYLEQFL